MKLPGIRIGPVQERGDLPQPDYISKSRATTRLVNSVVGLGEAIYNRQVDTELTGAMGDAAQELSGLRAKLETSRTIPSEEVPDDIVHEVGTTIVDNQGNIRDIGKPFVFTHEVADEWWNNESRKIVDNYASRISNRKARQKFLDEMGTRYMAPGTQAIAKASIIKQRAHNQATAMASIQDVLAANAPTEERESQAKEIISRQLLNGADPVWAQQQLASIGPRVDQIDTQNAILQATTPDELELIEEQMWAGDNRMSPDQMRTMSVQMDKKRSDFEFEKRKSQERGGAELTSQFFQGDLSVSALNQALISERVDRPTAMVLYNALTQGGTTKASNEFTLSRWRQEIIKLPYTGARSTVSAKGDFLKKQVQFAAMGLNPDGSPLPTGPTISGTDAAKLVEEIDRKVETALETPEYDNAWGMVKSSTGVQLDPITGMLVGNQPNKNAAIAFKQALDTYMDQYGEDADPVQFFNQNRGSFAPENYEDPVNQEFIDFFPAAKRFMTVEPDSIKFSKAQQAQFLKWLTTSVEDGTISEGEGDRIAAQFLAYYRGQGIAPNGGELSLEPDHPLYRQFQ